MTLAGERRTITGGTAALSILKADSKRRHKGRAFPLTRRLRGHHDFPRVSWG
jgi:hypothetical protein